MDRKKLFEETIKGLQRDRQTLIQRINCVKKKETTRRDKSNGNFCEKKRKGKRKDK